MFLIFSDSIQSYVVQGRNVFFLCVFFCCQNRLLALKLLYVNQCMIWRLYIAFVDCLQHLEILSDIYGNLVLYMSLDWKIAK